MKDLFLDNIYLILLLPLWIFLIVMVGRFFSVYVKKYIIYILTLLSSALGAFLSAGALWKLPAQEILETSAPFIKINDFIINFGLHVDKTSLIFSLVLFLISFCVQLFSISFMKDEKKTYRFFALLNLFNFAMCGLFFSQNLFQMYLFWEIIAISSYLLIGFEYFKNNKSFAAKKVFIINRIGDTALLGAIMICSYFIYSYAPNKSLATLSFIDMNTISTLIYAYTSTPLFWLICIMFLTGAIIKSAQFPFYNWLQDAMEAKLPVSALLHSSTLVASGIYLTLRIMPFLTLETKTLNLLIIIGLLTAIICSISACAQDNPKKVLAYSTSAQFGIMYFAIGMLNIKAAITFFIAHAFIKTVLFLTLPKENQKWNYINLIFFLVAGLSLSGILFSGMIAKEMIAYNLDGFKTVILATLSFLTAFYIIKIALMLYSKEENLEKKCNSKIELTSVILLFALNILFYIYLHFNTQYQIAECFWAALTAWVCVYILYLKNAFWKVPILYPLAYNGFYLDKFYMTICVYVYTKFSKICYFIDEKILSNYAIVTNSAKLSVKFVDFIETKIMNGTISAIVKTFRKCSLLDLKAQNGNIQRYNTYAFIIITIILICLILGYSYIITGVSYVD